MDSIVMLPTNSQGCFMGGEPRNTICATSEVQRADLGGAVLLLMSFLGSLGFFYGNWKEIDSFIKNCLFKFH